MVLSGSTKLVNVSVRLKEAGVRSRVCATPSTMPEGGSADASLSPSLPSGSYWELLQALWRSGIEGGKEWDASPITEVAFFTQGFVRGWYFTARDGTLRKKKMKSLGVSELATAFARGESTGFEEDVVAYAIFGPNGVMDAAGRAGSSVAPLERASLHWLLDQRDSSRRRELQAILKYVRPRGRHEAVLRFDWRAQVCSFELRSSISPIKSASSASVVPPYQRLSTHGPALVHSQKETHVTVAAVREASAVCEKLAERLQPDVPRDRARVCADFKLLGGDRVLLMWASMPAPGAVFPASDFPASMPCATIPKIAVAEAKAPQVDHALLVPHARRPDAGVSVSEAPPASGAVSALTARPVCPGFSIMHGGPSSLDPNSPRRIPGAGLMCSRYFVCRGCGRAELRQLAMQPERDVQSAKAPSVLRGTVRASPSSDCSTTSVAGSSRSRPSSSTTRARCQEQERPRSAATLALSARFASPRLIVRSVDGFHIAGMCAKCSIAGAVAAKADAGTPVILQESRAPGVATAAHPPRPRSSGAPGHRKADESMTLSVNQSRRVVSESLAKAPGREPGPGPGPGLAPLGRPAIAEYVRAQATAKWLRQYFNDST